MNLAIKGHATRGSEVIALLEILGGINNDCSACFVTRVYFINENNYIDHCDCMHHLDYFQLTLEEFEEKFPYKVGDKVKTVYGKVGIITRFVWDSKDNTIRYELVGDVDSLYFTNELQPYKEETMEEKGDKAKAPNLIGEDYSGKRFGYKIPNGYEFDCIKNNEIILKPKHPKYPKTYKECCDVLGILNDCHLTLELDTPAAYDLSVYKEFNYVDELEKLRKLIICRNAYWKIAGEEMKLDKSWEPDFTVNIYYPSIIVEYDEVVRRESKRRNVILVFPTLEMCKFFYENFKNLIKQCRKLL